MSTWTIADAFNVYHRLDCQHSERIARTPEGRYRCNGCGEESRTTTTTTSKEGTNESD